MPSKIPQDNQHTAREEHRFLEAAPLFHVGSSKHEEKQKLKTPCKFGHYPIYIINPQELLRT